MAACPAPAGSINAQIVLQARTSQVYLRRRHRLVPVRASRCTSGAQPAQLHASAPLPAPQFNCRKLTQSRICVVRGRVRSPVDGRGRVQDDGRRPRLLRKGQPSPEPVTIKEWLSRAGRLSNVNSTKVPALAFRCMQQLASFPRGSIGRSDLSATVRAINTALAAAAAVRNKPRLLSDLGKTLQAQPALRGALRRSPDFRGHLASLFSLAAADPTSFSDAVNASQLATAQIKTGHHSAAFWASLERTGLRGLPPRQFANVVYAAAKLHADCGAPRPSPGLQQRIWHAIEAGGHRLTAGMTPQHVANVWWALAALNLPVPAPSLDVLKAAAIRVAPDMAPQNVSNTLWAFAVLGIHINGLFAPMEAAVIAVAPRANPQVVGNTLWAWATLQLPPGRILEPLTAVLPCVVPEMTDQHLSNVCWAWGALRLPTARAMPVLEQGFLRLAAEDGAVSAQALANIWWSWARLRVTDEAIAPRFYAVLAHLGDTCDALTAVIVVKAAATLTRPPPPQLLVQVMRAAVAEGPQMGVWDCTNMLWALGVLAVVGAGPVNAAAARGAPQGGHSGGLAAYETTVQCLAERLLQAYESGAEFAPEALNQVHAMSGLLGLAARLGPRSRPFLQACHAAGVQRAGTMELRERQAGAASSDEGERVMGDKHQAVLETLRSLPELSHFSILAEATVGDGSRRVDILLEGRGVRLVVEVDGPSHFITDYTGNTLLRATGKTVLRDWQLREWGYPVLSVPVGSRSCAELRSAEAGALLLRGLRSIGGPL